MRLPRRHFLHQCAAAAVVGAGWSLAARGSNAPPARVVPLARAHAHNDYEHPRPLLDALDHGFASVEADIHLREGQLLVGHDPEDLRPGRTLEALYLKPLRARARAGRGAVHPGLSEFTLLIDLKTPAVPTYTALRPLLESYADVLTRFTPDRSTPGAVTVILSGDRPIEQVRSETIRFCAIDGRLPDLDQNPPVSLMPLISHSWRPTFSWFTDGQLPAADLQRLHEVVRRTHAQGRRLRFWGTQDQPQVWKALHTAGVDLINTDRLADLAGYLRSTL